jgi:hypothetical protein
MTSATRKQGMKKMRREKNRGTMRRLPGKCCDASMHSLNKWYDDKFEHLGWTVLAQGKGMTDKVQAYMNSLYRLKMALEQKTHKVYEVDRKNDLAVMLENVKILLRHCENNFA